MVKIAIIDTIGLTYDGNTLNHKGLGGSESAVILLSRELANIGFNVTVLNHCISDHSKDGIHDGVLYVDHKQVSSMTNTHFDIVISSRSVLPFAPTDNLYNIVKSAKFKAVWLHDTFCKGDEQLESMLVNGLIDEVFTLSDFHTSYITNCNHGQRRMFEVLKNKVFQTRNGAVSYINDVDISAKDHDLFIYNAAVSKGMVPLVKDVWPLIKQQIPSAKLVVVGGYYKFNNNIPDHQELEWRELVSSVENSNLDITFTGIIKQQQVAEWLAKASFMLYPAAFPETFGISSLESLLYNTPIITCRFGALEETAVAQACYHIDYPVVPNGLYPTIDTKKQAVKLAGLAIQAYKDTYLHQQKMYYCNIVKDIAGWDGVALQWKQHLFKKLGLYLSVDDYRKVSTINNRVHQVFGRRVYNPEEAYIPRQTEQRMLIVSPVYNAEKYVKDCILSVASQDYDNYVMYIIDDASTDNTLSVIKKTLSTIPDNIKYNFKVISNTENKGAVYNQISTIRYYKNSGDIVMLLDGDDKLVNNNQIFHMYNNLYDGTTEFTYGSCWSMVDNIPLVAQHYPEHVKQSKSYREHKFNWNMPYTHLRTFSVELLGNDDSPFKDSEGNWFKAGGDGAVFYHLIEQASPNAVKAVTDIVYMYNDINPLNDYKVNGIEQTKNATTIINKPSKEILVDNKKQKTILIAIPTAKYIEPETMKSIYDQIIPDGYTTTFQYFYGYSVSQVRNLIADWAVKYDYLWAIDSDMSFAPDTLSKLLAHDKDVVSGLYIQRKPGQHILEIYRNGRNVPYDDIKHQGLVEIDSCGFGCVLVKTNVIKDIGYPQFVYKEAIDHRFTVSEDTYFCLKAKEKGFKVWADTSILCNHHGSSVFTV